MLPEWLSIKPVSTEKYNGVKERINDLGLHTVCVEAHCPNITDCWSSGTATFMVLGDVCTRGCRFCAVSKMAKGIDVDKEEPEKLAKAISGWGLDYVVITSVCRDDLPDQGASHFAECVKAIKNTCKKTLVEVLIPDFRGDISLLEKIVGPKPDVIGHNIETVERLSPSIRDRRANYTQSLELLANVKKLDKKIYTKSAMMLGMGETDQEVLQSLKDLREVGTDFIAVGQYLRPSKLHAEIKEYVTPEKFDYFKKKALEFGFLYAASGPFVRSSFKAGEYFTKKIISASKTTI